MMQAPRPFRVVQLIEDRMTSSKTTWQRGTRPRAERPERILVAHDTLIRNDIIAAIYGSSERALNRGDAKGAPYTLVAGVKYRPERGYQEFLTSQIQRRGGKPARRAGKRAQR
jgi:hypothetical protein